MQRVWAATALLLTGGLLGCTTLERYWRPSSATQEVGDLPSPEETIAAWRSARPALFRKKPPAYIPLAGRNRSVEPPTNAPP